MADSMVCSYNGASSVYALIRDRSALSTVWNGATMVAWVDGNINTYHLNLASQGGDVYAASVPAALPDGRYLLKYYVQAGGAPAITDICIFTQDRDWDGVSLSDPLEEPCPTPTPTPCGGTEPTYADLALRLIQDYCGRIFVNGTYTERVRLYNTRMVRTREYPIDDGSVTVEAYPVGTGHTDLGISSDDRELRAGHVILDTNYNGLVQITYTVSDQPDITWLVNDMSVWLADNRNFQSETMGDYSYSQFPGFSQWFGKLSFYKRLG